MQRRTFLQLTGIAAGRCAVPFRRARTADSKAARVVIVGGGFAGAACALHLRQLNPALAVTLVDPDDRHVTCPMSNSVLVGLRGMESITVSRKGLRLAGVEFLKDRVAAVDAERRIVRSSGGKTLVYDRLVVAPGIRFLWEKIEGYSAATSEIMPHAWIAGTQTQLLAARLAAIRNGGVVAISVPPGPMRCPPGPFERASLIAGYLQRHKPRSKVLIFDANNRFPKQDVFTDAWTALYPGMIEWIPVVDGGAVLGVSPSTMTLYTSHGAHRVDVANVIPPQAPGVLAAEAGLATEHGWCPVKADTFESTLIADIHVIGDACIADPMPKAASSANAQARQCALAIVGSLAGRSAPATVLESVCYSLLAPGRALSVHGSFTAAGGIFQQLPQAPQSISFPEEAIRAGVWYRDIVADSFGA